jgi:hypothetical protein
MNDLLRFQPCQQSVVLADVPAQGLLSLRPSSIDPLSLLYPSYIEPISRLSSDNVFPFRKLMLRIMTLV